MFPARFSVRLKALGALSTFAMLLLVALILLATSSCRLRVPDPTKTPAERSIDFIGDGLEHEREGRLEEARDAFSKSIEISPRPAAYMGMARYYMEQDDFARAAAYLTNAVEEIPENRRVQLMLAQANLKIHGERPTEEPEGTAEEVVRDIARIDATGAEKPAKLDDVDVEEPDKPADEKRPTESSDRPTTPIEPPVVAQRTPPDEPRGRTYIQPEGLDEIVGLETVEIDGQQVLVETDAIATRRMTVAQAIDLRDNPPGPLELPSQAELSMVFFGDAPDLSPHGGSSIALTSDPDFYIERAHQAVLRGERDQARADLVQALRIQPDNAQALVDLGSIYDDAGQPKRARELYDQARAVAPENPRIYYKMGNTFLRRGMPDEALLLYNMAIELNPRHIFAIHNAGVALLRNREFETAAKRFSEVIDLDPGYAPAYRHMGNIAETYLEDPKAATALYREYLERGGRDRALVESWIRDLEQ